MSTLKKDWNPAFGIAHILIVIKCLLISPNPDSALNADAGRLLQEAYEDYAEMAKLWTAVHASQAPPSGLFDDVAAEESHCSSHTTQLAPDPNDHEALNSLKIGKLNHQISLEKGASTFLTVSLSHHEKIPLASRSIALKRGIKRL